MRQAIRYYKYELLHQAKLKFKCHLFDKWLKRNKKKKKKLTFIRSKI